MQIHNTTNIPSNHIIDAIKFNVSMHEDMFRGVIVPKVELHRNPSFLLGGQYFLVTKEISMNAPIMFPFWYTSQYTGIKSIFHNYNEFLVSVLAHELRHAWQFQVSMPYLHSRNVRMYIREIEEDAETFEHKQLQAFRQTIELAKAA